MKDVNSKILSLQSIVSELTRSLEYTQKDVDELTQQVVQQENEDSQNKSTIKELKTHLQDSEKVIKDLEGQGNYQEDHNRRNNLQIIGVEEKSGGETCEQTAVQVSKLLEKFQLPSIQFERAHRVGQRSEDRGRAIIARFSRFGDREAVIRNVKKLRETKIFINEDMCPASQCIRKVQLPLLKEARIEGKISFFSVTPDSSSVKGCRMHHMELRV